MWSISCRLIARPKMKSLTPMTLLKNPSNSLEVDCATQQSAADLLRGLCRNPGLHARFLNTISLMEHIGSRKIMLSQGKSTLPESILRHLNEETRHAHFFRRAAE